MNIREQIETLIPFKEFSKNISHNYFLFHFKKLSLYSIPYLSFAAPFVFDSINVFERAVTLTTVYYISLGIPFFFIVLFSLVEVVFYIVHFDYANKNFFSEINIFRKYFLIKKSERHILDEFGSVETAFSIYKNLSDLDISLTNINFKIFIKNYSPFVEKKKYLSDKTSIRNDKLNKQIENLKSKQSKIDLKIEILERKKNENSNNAKKIFDTNMQLEYNSLGLDIVELKDRVLSTVGGLR